MKTYRCLAIAVAIALLLPMASTEAVAQTATAGQEAELNELLDTSLGSLADWSYRNRQVGGWVMVGLGAATAVAGVTVLAVADADTEDADIIGWSLIGGGVVLGGLSLLPFKIRGESERVYDEYSAMASGTAAQARARFAYGDRSFEQLARNRRTERYVSGAILLAIGIGDLFVLDDWHEWIGFGTPLIGGLTSLLLKSEEERRFESYQRAKQDLLGPAGTAPTVGVGLGVLPRRGLAWQVQVRF